MVRQPHHKINEEQLVLDAYRQMSDDCQRNTLTTMQAMARAFPRREPPALSLVSQLAGKDRFRQ